MMERRWSTRKQLSLDVALIYTRLGILRCQTSNVSLDGMFIRTGPIVLPHNAPLDIVFELEEGERSIQYRLPALVVRVAEDGVGTLFRNVEIGAFKALQKLLRVGSRKDLPQSDDMAAAHQPVA